MRREFGGVSPAVVGSTVKSCAGTAGGRCTVAAGIVLVLATFPGTGFEPLLAQDTLPSDLEREIAEIAAAAMDSVPAAGWAVGIVRGDSLIYARGFGYADLESRTPVTGQTLFQIASVSKSFTGTLAARLVDQSLLDLGAPASTYLWNNALEETGVTVAQLAAHTSGLPSDAPNLRRLHDDYPVLRFSHFELYRGLAESQLGWVPGSRFGYSNFGYGVLGHILEIATQTPYEVLLEREIFEPLGMTSSTVTLWPELADRLATPYAHDESGALAEYTPWRTEALAPASGITSSLRDMGRYVAYQIEASGEESMVAQTHVPRTTVDESRSYGIGWWVEDFPGIGRVISHGGDLDGYVAEILISPDYEIGTIVLANSDPAGPFQGLGRWILSSMRADSDPEAAQATQYWRARIHHDLRQWAQAVESYRALTDGPDPHRPALYHLGRLGAGSGTHLQEAERALLKYLSLEPLPWAPRAAALWHLGRVYEHAGRCAEAEVQYQRAAQENYMPAQRSLERFRCSAQSRS